MQAIEEDMEALLKTHAAKKLTAELHEMVRCFQPRFEKYLSDFHVAVVESAAIRWDNNDMGHLLELILREYFRSEGFSVTETDFGFIHVRVHAPFLKGENPDPEAHLQNKKREYLGYLIEELQAKIEKTLFMNDRPVQFHVPDFTRSPDLLEVFMREIQAFCEKNGYTMKSLGMGYIGVCVKGAEMMTAFVVCQAVQEMNAKRQKTSSSSS